MIGKDLLIERYKYLYNNSYYLLALNVKKESKCTQELREKLLKELNLSYNQGVREINLCIDDDTCNMFEEFLFSNNNINKTRLYHEIENIKLNKNKLYDVKNGLELVNEYNSTNDTNISLGIEQVLDIVYKYIDRQTGDNRNKERKLNIILEYYKLHSYKNDGNIYLNNIYNKLVNNNNSFIRMNKNNRNKNDIGIKNNSFIRSIINSEYNNDNYSIFSEEEKQEVYLSLHNELPWNLEFTCSDNNKELTDKQNINKRPCNNIFNVREELIFNGFGINKENFYQVCPHCGYIVKIPNQLLSSSIKKKIIDRCYNDKDIYKKISLYSSLLTLDYKTSDDNKILKKTNKK